MTLKRFATEYGMGVDLRGQDYTKAAVRAVKDALHRNSLTVAAAVGKDPSEMIIRCTIGVAKPDAVDVEKGYWRWSSPPLIGDSAIARMRINGEVFETNLLVLF